MLETYRRYLAGEPLDLDKLYFQIQCTPFADQYPRSDFLRTRIKEISYVLNSWYEEQKRVANINSISTAKLAQIVLSTAHAFGGSKEPVKSKIGDFLPFEYDPQLPSPWSCRWHAPARRCQWSGRISCFEFHCNYP